MDKKDESQTVIMGGKVMSREEFKQNKIKEEKRKELIKAQEVKDSMKYTAKMYLGLSTGLLEEDEDYRKFKEDVAEGLFTRESAKIMGKVEKTFDEMPVVSKVQPKKKKANTFFDGTKKPPIKVPRGGSRGDDIMPIDVQDLIGTGKIVDENGITLTEDFHISPKELKSNIEERIKNRKRRRKEAEKNAKKMADLVTEHSSLKKINDVAEHDLAWQVVAMRGLDFDNISDREREVLLKISKKLRDSGKKKTFTKKKAKTVKKVTKKKAKKAAKKKSDK
jgi:hypothetical protein